MPPSQLFRVRIVLRALRPIRTHPLPAAELYGLLCNAYGVGTESEKGIPETLLLEITEQSRTAVVPGELYAFGLTILVASPNEATRQLQPLVVGLSTLGEKPATNQPVWGGNFRIEVVEDLIRGEKWNPGEPLSPLPFSTLVSEIAKLEGQSKLTLRFLSPLRCERGDHDRREGHEYFDREFFDAASFLFRLEQRAAKLGFRAPIQRDHPRDPSIRAAENELVWIDMSYGPRARRKSLGGAMGRIRFENVSPAAVQTLVLGQSIRSGGNAKFGFGRYRIEELGDEPYPCHRAKPLLGPNPDFGMVARRLGPTLHTFSDESAVANRLGLVWKYSKQAWDRARSEGFTLVVDFDFSACFASLEHAELERRLESYLRDDDSVQRIMGWVRSNAPSPGYGLRPDFPLADFLVRVMLDQVVEWVSQTGGRLMRTETEFVVVFRPYRP